LLTDGCSKHINGHDLDEPSADLLACATSIATCLASEVEKVECFITPQ
jgi:hypothetical protein